MQQTAAAVCFVIEVTRRIVEEQRLNTLPLLERQQRLAEIVTPNKSVQLVQSHSDGEALFHAIRPQHMEGIVAKNIHSTYSIDGKDNRWIKIKNYGCCRGNRWVYP